MDDEIVQRNLYVNMEREHLEDLPSFPLPTGIRMKWYERGDEQIWVDIHRLAEDYVPVSLDVFRRVFGDDEQALCERQCFLFDAQRVPIATATAWFENDFHGLPFGRVHWVAVVPDYRGQGLSKPLLSIVLSRMSELGHQRVFLRTSTARLPAIELYRGFGFVPSLRSEEEREIWRRLNSHLREPFDV